MRAAMLAAASAFLAGCTFADAQIRKSAAKDFSCPEDEIVLHRLPSGYLARGCRKEAEYLLQDDRVKRNSEIKKAAFDERPPVPIDSTASNVTALPPVIPRTGSDRVDGVDFQNERERWHARLATDWNLSTRSCREISERRR